MAKFVANLYDRLIYRDKELQSRTLYVATKEWIRVDENGRFAEELAATEALKSLKSTPDDALVQAVGADGRLDAERFVALGTDADKIVENAELADAQDGVEVEIWLFKARRVSQTLNPLHPEAGKTVVARFFQPFEARTLEKIAQETENQRDSAGTVDGANVAKSAGRSATLGLNYFFQDEL